MEAIEALPHCLHPWRTCRLTAALDPAAEFAHELDFFAQSWGVAKDLRLDVGASGP